MRIHDYSEPCLWIGAIFGAVSVCYSAVMGAAYWIVASACLCCTGSIGAQRVHSLGLASSMAESAETYREENEKLVRTVADLEAANQTFEVQVNDLRGIAKLLEGNERDLNEVEAKLRGTFHGIQRENRKHQNNNLVSLFTIVDKNNNGSLSPEEVERLAGYVETVYGQRMDLSALDDNNDKVLDLPEFIRLFESGQADDHINSVSPSP